MNIKPIIGLLAITSMGLSAVTQAQTWNFTTFGTTGADGPLGGGGGGSFVWRGSDNQLLLAAGGGGGAGDGFSSADANGAPATAAETGSLVTGLSACVTLATAGEGWQSSNYTCGGEFSGGGAGWNSLG